MQLEEFRKKKEAALAAKKAAAAAAEAAGPAAAAHPPPTAPPATVATATVSTQKEKDDLKAQVSHLLKSVDDLHRALQEERGNSAQLEERLLALQASGANAPSGPTDAHAAMDILVQTELQETREAASRYATAAEAAAEELARIQEERDGLQAELAAAQETFGRIAEYKQMIDEFEEQLEAARAGAQAASSAEAAAQAAKEQLAEAAAQQAQQEAAAQELRSELDRQKELNHRMKEELMQAAAAEEAADAATSAAADAATAEAAALREQLEGLSAQLKEARGELTSRAETEAVCHTYPYFVIVNLNSAYSLP